MVIKRQEKTFTIEPVVFMLQDFLYLSGILEPDSALVLHGEGRPDQTILFVPRRDPGRELWDGPRSGRDGAAALTGIERVHSTEEMGLVLKSLNGEKTTCPLLRLVKYFVMLETNRLHFMACKAVLYQTKLRQCLL